MAQKDFYKMKAAVNGATEILIYNPIGDSYWEETTTAKNFIAELNALTTPEITIRINSAGGSVIDGIAIYNAIKRHPSNITTVNDGVAASIASVILMAGDTVEMADNAQIMVHAPMTVAMGNEQDLEQAKEMLASWRESMATAYAAKTGKEKQVYMDLMADGKDHWYTAEQALAEGFIDNITGGLAIAASLDRGAIQAQLKDFYAVKAVKEPATSTVAAATTSQEFNMTTKTDPQAAATTTPANTQTPEQIAQAALAQDQARRDGIAQAFSKFTTTAGVPELMAACQNDVHCTTQMANDKLLAKLGEASAPVAGGYAVVIEDQRDKMRAGFSQALLARAGLAKAEGNNQFNGFTLVEMARASLEGSGVKTGGFDKMRLVAEAFTHGSSDFTNLLSNIANKAMMKGFEEAEETFQLWTSVGNLSDFKATSRVDLNAFPSLRKVQPGAEYKYATVGDRGETVQLATYGELFSINRQAIINDDLNAFTKLPMMMGRAAIRTVGDLVYAVLTGNPTMADGKALFHADHGGNAISAAAISTASVDAMRVIMAKQKLGEATLNVRLAHLIVPVALEGAAKTVQTSQWKVGGTDSTNNQTVPNTVANTFDVISDARLDKDSASKWYGAGNPSVVDTIEVQYLDGNQAPTLEQQNGWGIDGVEFKVRMDAGVKALAYQGLAKNG